MQAGAVLVNDVSGGLADPGMLPLMAAARRPYVLMHWRGPSAEMAALATYDDVVRDVRVELGRRLAEAGSAGVDPGFVVLDPGLGFAKDGSHNWSLLSHLGELGSLGRPLLVGASRKRFLGEVLGGAGPDDRDLATAATSALAAVAGAWCVRVHEPAASRDAVAVAAAWRAAGGGPR
jgi:dihydropteroate synthase